MKQVTYVAYGMGVDSTGMLVGLMQRGERPDLILFADTGDEKPETYAYLPVINAWLDKVGFPQVTVVKNARPKSHDKSLSESCLRNSVLPALAFNRHSCSIVWKLDPQMSFLKGISRGPNKKPGWQPALDAWKRGEKVVTLIGYDAGPRDSCRAGSAMGKAKDGFINRFPLIEWGWDRERCKAEIIAAGLPVPMKSACFFCPASKTTEIDWLKRFHPELAAKAVEIETRAKERGLTKIKGLGGRKFAWGDYLSAK